MPNNFETPQYTPQPVENQVDGSSYERSSKSANLLDTVALGIVRIADKLEQRKASRAETPLDEQSEPHEFGKELVLYTGDLEDTAAERESSAKKILRRIGSAAGGALQAGKEYTVGVGTVLGGKAQDRAEAFMDNARIIGSEFKADFIDLKDEIQTGVAEKKESFLEFKQERAEAALARKEARHQKWAARKQALASRVDSFRESASLKIDTAKDKATQFGRNVQGGAQSVQGSVRSAYETTVGVGVDGAIAAAELKRKAQEKATALAEATSERGRNAAEKARQGGERLRTHSENMRAVGKAALNASKQEYQARYPASSQDSHEQAA